MKFLHVTVLFISALMLGACQGEKEGKGEVQKTPSQTARNTSESKVLTPRDIEASSKALLEKSFLRDVLPDSSYAYARIPNSWTIAGVPTGNIFNKPLASKPYVDALTAIREGFGTKVIPELPEEAKVFLGLLLQHARSTVEATVIKSAEDNKGNPIPNVLLTVAVDYKNVDGLNALLDVLVSKDPNISIDKRLQKDAMGELTIQGLKLQIKLDLAKSRVFVLGGAQLNANSMEDALKTLKANPDHAMRQFENDIDNSGQGLFAWVDPRELLTIAKSMGQERQLAPMAMMGVNSIKNIAFGLGSSGGINRFKVIVDMPKTGFRAMIPAIKDSPTFSVAGDTSFVVTLGLPSKADFVSIETSLAGMTKARDMNGYYDLKKVFSEAAGFEIEEVFEVFGQDISFIADEAGWYYTVRLRDADKFNEILDKLIKKYDLKHEEREIAGQKYHHLTVPTLNDPSFFNGNPLLMRFLGVPSHVFWQQEGDYLIVASLPQILMDRHYVSKQPVNDWYKKNQRMNPEGALLMAAMRTRGVPAFMYRIRLAILSYLGDVTERPVDLFALPSVKEAGLPENGAYGFKLTSTENQLAFELTFESNPYELIFALFNNYAGIVVTGVLAAMVVVPAYENSLMMAPIVIHPKMPKEEVLKPAPEFSLPNTKGGQLRLSDYKGKLVLLNFWASWCPPCRAEIPEFIKIQTTYQDKSFTFLGVAVEEKNSADKYAKEVGINYPTSYGLEDTVKVAEKYGNPDGGLPYSVLISPEQKIIGVYSGFLDGDKLKGLIEKNLP